MPREIAREHTLERQGATMILYKGLLSAAHDDGLQSIITTLLQIPSAENGNVAIAYATVVMKDERVFSGIGDASPANVSRLMAPHIIRMSETRAKARALRDAVNIGDAVVEELGDDEPVRQQTNLGPQHPRTDTPPTERAGAPKPVVKLAVQREGPPADVLPENGAAERFIDDDGPIGLSNTPTLSPKPAYTPRPELLVPNALEIWSRNIANAKIPKTLDSIDAQLKSMKASGRLDEATYLKLQDLLIERLQNLRE